MGTCGPLTRTRLSDYISILVHCVDEDTSSLPLRPLSMVEKSESGDHIWGPITYYCSKVFSPDLHKKECVAGQCMVCRQSSQFQFFIMSWEGHLASLLLCPHEEVRAIVRYHKMKTERADFRSWHLERALPGAVLRTQASTWCPEESQEVANSAHLVQMGWGPERVSRSDPHSGRASPEAPDNALQYLLSSLLCPLLVLGQASCIQHGGVCAGTFAIRDPLPISFMSGSPGLVCKL